MEWKPLMVMLTSAEREEGVVVGDKRQRNARARGYVDQHGFDGEDGWEKNVEGACGEVAVAKLLGVPWPATIDTYSSGADIGRLIQVRTRPKMHYDQLIRPDDLEKHPLHYFVLALGWRPKYTIMGWIRGIDAKRPEWVRTYGDRPPAWFPPQDALCKDFILLRELGM